MPGTLKQVVDRVKAAKTAIATAITAQGGTVGAADGLEEFASDIATIPSYKSTLTDLIERDITSIDIPDNVTRIGNYIFYACTDLTSITIPGSVTSIGSSAFSGCTGLTTIIIPSSVTEIAFTTFNGCTNLTTITINKAEGSITGAPWGATNATVVWTG